MVNWKKELNIFAILAFGGVVLSYVVLNLGAYIKEVQYNLLSASDISTAPPANADDEIEKLAAVNLHSATATNVIASAAAQSNSRYTLVIPKLSITVPMVYPPNDSSKDVLAALEKGVGIFSGSTDLGKPGRMVVLGHSSKASWYRGNYATIFAVLEKLEPKDRFYVIEGRTKYIYMVFSKQFLTPVAANEIFAGDSIGSELDLMTCWPTGSAKKRAVIRAMLIETQAI